MYKLCKTEQSAARQRALEEGLLAAISTHRYEELSVSDLCIQMGIPRKSFYRYFSSKEGALFALIDHTLLRFEEYSTTIGNRTAQRDMALFFQFWVDQQPFLDAMEKNGLYGLLIQRSIAYSTNGALPQRFLVNDPPEVRPQIAMFAVSGLMSLVVSWHQQGYPKSVDKMAEIAVRALAQPLFSALP